MEEKSTQRNPFLGELTFVDITDTANFQAACQPDAWGVSRAPFSIQTARMSAELCADGYMLDIGPWMEAGWTDCTFVVEEQIVELDFDAKSRLSRFEGEWRRRRARNMIRGVKPVNDLMRAVRQLMVTDLGKAIVMTHPIPDGRYVVAISFIGTTQKYYDWFANFKFHRDTGMHFGFLQLARNFDAQATRILLPKLAAALGEETFTLADAVLEAAKPDSRVVLWVSGHSQGGAIVQTYTHLLTSQHSVPAGAIQGYTFAAPSVAASDGQLDPKVYPIYNVINTDDIVPRVGAQIRLGMDYIYRPTNAFRERHYRVDDELKEAFDRLLYMQKQIQSTRESFCWGISFLRLMGEMDGDEALESLFEELIPYASVLRRVKLTMTEVSEFLERKLSEQLEKLNGDGPDEPLCDEYKASIRSVIDKFGPQKAAKALQLVITEPHHLRPAVVGGDFIPSYLAIVRHHLQHCEQGVWLPDAPARCMDAAGQQLLPEHIVFEALPMGPAERIDAPDPAEDPQAIEQGAQPPDDKQEEKA